MFGLNGLDSAAQLEALLPVRFALLIAALLVFVERRAEHLADPACGRGVWQGMATGVGAALAIMTISQPHPFIYFQF